MRSNTSSSDGLGRSGGAPAGLDGLPARPEGLPPRLAALAAVVDDLAADDPGGVGDAPLAAEVVAMRHLADRLEADWLRRLATVDARGAAGAELGAQAPSTAGWLRATCRLSPALAGQHVRTARALHRGPLAGTAAALAAGEVSPQHAAVLADATSGLPPRKVAEAEPVLVDAARRLDPPRLHRLAAHLRDLVDPEAAEARAQARLDQRGLWLAGTFEGMVAVKGLLDPETGEATMAALAALARPSGPDDERSAPQRRADALGELARHALQTGQLPQGGGLRPQLTVTVDLATLRAQHGGVGAAGGWGAVLPGETARRLACDAAVTRAIVRRHPTDAPHGTGDRGGQADGGSGDGGLAAELRAAQRLLPPPLGAPVEVLDLGRATRVISPGLRRALAVRDGGCAAPGCDRPPPWTDAHHLDHWLHGGPTSLDNLILLCRSHHRAVHEGGWQLGRDPASGQDTLAPQTRHYANQRPPPAA